MIKLIKIKTGSSFWEIDGVVIRFQRKKCIGDSLTGQSIEEYRELLLNEGYRDNPLKICELDSVLGDVVLLRIGSEVYPVLFLKMFAYYAECYVKEWCAAGNRFVSNKTSFFPIFVYMFKNHMIDRAGSPVAILKNTSCDNKLFSDIYEEKFALFWSEQIKNKVESEESLHAIKEQIGALRTTEYFCRISSVVATKYLQAMANHLTKKRRIITVQGFYRILHGDSVAMSRKRLCPDFVRMADEAVEKEFALQCGKFIEDNHRQLDVNADRWVLFYKHRPSLFTNIIDFTKIQSKSLRLEIKYFMKYRYYSLPAKKDAVIHTLTDAVNLMTGNNPVIHFFADIDDADVRTLYMAMERRYGQNSAGKSVSYIMRVFNVLSVLMEYLMGDRRDDAMRSPKPHDNPFKRYKFYNAKDYKARTPIIPESVAEGIDRHLHELDDTQALLYRIFSDTGMRMKEVLFLETDCLEPSPYDDLVQLKYKPYKTLKAKRKQGAPDYHRVLIFQSLADEITRQIHERAKWREELDLPYIFVNHRPNFRTGMINMGNYVLIINKLIKRHSLCDEGGETWHFTSKQQRKTLAATLIENGGSVDELAY